MQETILVVDDNPNECIALVEEIGSEYQITFAKTHAEGISRLMNGKPDVSAVVSCDGNVEIFELAKRKKPDLPRIIVSDDLDEELLERLLVTGIVHVCVRKPWRSGAFLKALQQRILS